MFVECYSLGTQSRPTILSLSAHLLHEVLLLVVPLTSHVGLTFIVSHILEDKELVPILISSLNNGNSVIYDGC